MPFDWSDKAGMALAQRLANADPSNTRWQRDLSVSHARLGSCLAVSARERREHLQSGLRILKELHADGRLAPADDSRAWFIERLGELQ